MSRTFGIDARAAVEVPAGRGRYVRELLRHLAKLPGDDRWVLFARKRWEEQSLDDRFSWRLHDLPDPAWHLAAGLGAAGCDAFLSTNSYLTSWVCRSPCAVVVYDMIAFRPEYEPQRRAAVIERATIRLGLRRASALLAISQATRDDLVDLYPATAAKTVVVPLAADRRFSPERRPSDDAVLHGLGVRFPYVLSTGTLEPRKNLVRLIEAFASLSPVDRMGHRLVVAGPEGWEVQPILDRAKSHAGVVLTLGRVSEEQLEVLYRRAGVLAYPSLYEGFGLPVLEAMQSGAPVLTSDRSSLPEVAGDCAVYVDPSEIRQISAALRRLLTDHPQRARMAALGLARAQQFDWAVTARATRDILAQISDSPAPGSDRTPI
ncbi:MAG: glycosyltransferase family 4 protein [Solirubrobacterales bacterium]